MTGKLCIVSHTWVSDDQQYAKVPKLKGTQFKEAVKKHTVASGETSLWKIKVLCNCHTYDLTLKAQSQVEKEQCPSSDGTWSMGLAAKRPPCPERSFSSDDESEEPVGTSKPTCEKSFSWTKKRSPPQIDRYQRPSTSHTAGANPRLHVS